MLLSWIPRSPDQCTARIESLKIPAAASHAKHPADSSPLRACSQVVVVFYGELNAAYHSAAFGSSPIRLSARALCAASQHLETAYMRQDRVGVQLSASKHLGCADSCSMAATCRNSSQTHHGECAGLFQSQARPFTWKVVYNLKMAAAKNSGREPCHHITCARPTLRFGRDNRPDNLRTVFEK
jgi:hypothetical protein